MKVARGRIGSANSTAEARSQVTQPEPYIPAELSDYCIGLTGGIACGKSVVGRLLEDQGLVRVDADQVARDVVAYGSEGLAEIVEIFGERCLTPEGGLDRATMGQRVFASSEDRARLGAILHPRIWRELSTAMKLAKMERRETVIEIPLLFENGRESHFNTIWVVAVSPALQKLRLAERDGLTPQQSEQRIASQMDVWEKAQRASFVITNDGGLEELKKQVDNGLVNWRACRALNRVEG